MHRTKTDVAQSGQVNAARRKKTRWGAALLSGMGLLALLAPGKVAAQTSARLVRLAKIEVYPAQLEAYKAALKLGVETALRVEPGVLTLYPLAEKNQPTRFTILEIYASPEAYQAHLRTPHFLKYKADTKSMIKSLELIETQPLLPGGLAK